MIADPDEYPAGHPGRELFDALAAMRLKAGRPSYRDIARVTERDPGLFTVSASAVHNILHYRLLPPKWPPVQAVVRVLGGDEQEAFRLWQDAHAARGRTAGTPESRILDQAAQVLREFGKASVRLRVALRVLDAESRRLAGEPYNGHG